MIGVIAHDSGGAEIISSYVSRNALECVFCLGGPAIKIFERKLGQIQILSLEEVIHQSNWILCGTSSDSSLEWEAIFLSRKAGKRSVVMLDHWVNYQGRFERNKLINLPDELWVGDEFAMKIASNAFLDQEVKLVPNAYFSDIRDELVRITKKSIREKTSELTILYVTEPTDERSGYTSEEALSFFLSHVGSIDEPITNIILRPHPKDNVEKYETILKSFPIPVTCDDNKSLVEQVMDSQIVVGCATMAMVVGLLAGKRVISCIPPGGKTEPLPHTEIEDWSNLSLDHGKKRMFY